MNTKLVQTALAVIAAALISTFATTTPDHRASTQGWQHAALTGPAPASKSPGGGGVELEGGDSPSTGGNRPESPPPAGGDSPANIAGQGGGGTASDLTKTDNGGAYAQADLG